VCDVTTERIAALLLCACCILGLASCHDDCDCPDCGGGSAADGGVFCEAEPAECGDLGNEAAQHFGCCFDGTVYWCDADALESIDCQAIGHPCGYSETGDYMDCI